MMLWFILFFGVAAFGATEWWSRALLEFFIFTLSAMCALRRDFTSPSRGLLMGIGVIVFIGVVQALNVRALAGPASFLPFSAARPQTLYALLMWTALGALIWSASGILVWEGALRRLAWAVYSIGLFIAVVGILQRGLGNTAYYGLRRVRLGRPFGPFTNYNHAANWMAASTLVGAGLFAELLQRRGRAPAADRAAHLTLTAFVLCVSVGAVLMTESRGGFHALFLAAFLTAGLISVSFIRGQARLLLLGGVASAGLAYACFLYQNPKWIGLIGGATDYSTGYRLSMYRAGLRMLADFPAFGVGLGGFQNAFLGYQEPLVFGLVDHVHNSWLEIALEAGLVGAVAVGAAFLAPLAALGRRLTRADCSPLDAGCFAAVLALCLHGLVEFNFQIPANAVVTVVLFAVVPAKHSAPENKEPAERPRKPHSAAIFVAMAVLSLLPGLSGWLPRYGPPFLSVGEQLLARSPGYNLHGSAVP